MLYSSLTKSQQEQLDFVLIRQKDRILRLINQRKFSEAEQALKILSELWVDAGYDYKRRELIQRLQDAKLSSMR